LTVFLSWKLAWELVCKRKVAGTGKKKKFFMDWWQVARPKRDFPQTRDPTIKNFSTRVGISAL
jgi:hypothetical protein